MWTIIFTGKGWCGFEIRLRSFIKKSRCLKMLRGKTSLDLIIQRGFLSKRQQTLKIGK